MTNAAAYDKPDDGQQPQRGGLRHCADVGIAVMTASRGSMKPGQTQLDELDATSGIVSRLCRK
ncbi:MAG: hypothetical protein GPOALKHO_000363 [Sodalis sp.]|nr:MAG: hypothetical protein GPOALKHO_000363 [Sodalis sp.]